MILFVVKNVTLAFFLFLTLLKKKLDDLYSQEEDSSNLYPCRKCRNECVVDCIQCDECDEWFHYECVLLTEEEFTQLGSNKYRDFYCGRCALLQLPFYHSQYKIAMNDLP